MSRCDAGETIKPSRACKIFSPNEHAKMRALPGIFRRSLGAHASSVLALQQRRA